MSLTVEFNMNSTPVCKDLYKGLTHTVIKIPSLCRQGLILELNNHLIRLHPLRVPLNRISRVLFLFQFILFTALIYCAIGKSALEQDRV